MPIEQLTYAEIAERLGISSEAARAIVKRHRLPCSRSNDGKTLAAIDLEEIRHKPLPTRSPRGDHAVTDMVATLKAKAVSWRPSWPRRKSVRLATVRIMSVSVTAPTAWSPPKTEWSPNWKISARF
jgi:hypothetical protein